MRISYPLGLVADDLTGADDTAVQFTYSKKKVTVYLEKIYTHNYSDVMAVSTFSRHMSKEDAYSSVYGITRDLLSAGAVTLYKKTDSVLRGNPGTEIDATLDASHISLALVCPAFPEMGRTVIHGILHVNGLPLADNENVGESVIPSEGLSAISLITRQSRRKTALIDIDVIRLGEKELLQECEAQIQRGTEIILFDAEKVDDLKCIVSMASKIQEKYVMSGSGGLARAMQACKPQMKMPLIHAEKGVLVICGSKSSIAHKQIENAVSDNLINQMEIDPLDLLHGDYELSNVIDAMRKGSTIFLSIGRRELEGNKETNARNIEIAVGDMICKLLAFHRPGAIIITGGDTAVSICRNLGAWGIDVVGEIEPGVPFGYLQGEWYNGMPIITKSGSFGDERIFSRIIRMINNKQYNK